MQCNIKRLNMEIPSKSFSIAIHTRSKVYQYNYGY